MKSLRVAFFVTALVGVSDLCAAVVTTPDHRFVLSQTLGGRTCIGAACPASTRRDSALVRRRVVPDRRWPPPSSQLVP